MWCNAVGNRKKMSSSAEKKIVTEWKKSISVRITLSLFIRCLFSNYPMSIDERGRRRREHNKTHWMVKKLIKQKSSSKGFNPWKNFFSSPLFSLPKTFCAKQTAKQTECKLKSIFVSLSLVCRLKVYLLHPSSYKFWVSLCMSKQQAQSGLNSLSHSATLLSSITHGFICNYENYKKTAICHAKVARRHSFALDFDDNRRRRRASYNFVDE